MDFERCGYSQSDLAEYAALFSACFPGANKLADVEYLRWLYVDNPSGVVIGFNARESGRLAAHYVCVPTSIAIDGRDRCALLSLNTATHPDFRGKGLFTRLAELTYAAGADEGAELVYGVANENSTPGFLRKLGFTLVSPLESRIGVGALGAFDWSILSDSARFRHSWTPESLAWRCVNPAAPVACHRTRSGALALSASAGRAGFRAWAEMPLLGAELHGALTPAPWRLRVWLGLLPKRLGTLGLYPNLPERLRPSPLNLIVCGLQQPFLLGADDVFFNFLDFDAF